MKPALQLVLTPPKARKGRKRALPAAFRRWLSAPLPGVAEPFRALVAARLRRET